MSSRRRRRTRELQEKLHSIYEKVAKLCWSEKERGGNYNIKGTLSMMTEEEFVKAHYVSCYRYCKRYFESMEMEAKIANTNINSTTNSSISNTQDKDKVQLTTRIGRQRIFTQEEELEILEELRIMKSENNNTLSWKDVRVVSTNYAQQKGRVFSASNNWVSAFGKRHNIKKKSQKRSLTEKRAQKSIPEMGLFDARRKAHFFAKADILPALVKIKNGEGESNEVLRHYRQSPKDIVVWVGQDKEPPLLYVGEHQELRVTVTGNVLHGPPPSRVVCLDEKNVNPHNASTSTLCIGKDDNLMPHTSSTASSWTLLFSTTASGKVVCPLLILRGKSVSLGAAYLGGDLDVTNSESGFITTPILLRYVDSLCKEFDPTADNPLYLELDGHSTRLNPAFIRKLQERHVHAILDLSNFSQVGQPNDRGSNRLFETFHQKCYSYVKTTPGAIPPWVKRDSCEELVFIVRQAVAMMRLHPNEIKRSFRLTALTTPFTVGEYVRGGSVQVMKVGSPFRKHLPQNTLEYRLALFSALNICRIQNDDVAQPIAVPFKHAPAGWSTENGPSGTVGFEMQLHFPGYYINEPKQWGIEMVGYTTRSGVCLPMRAILASDWGAGLQLPDEEDEEDEESSLPDHLRLPLHGEEEPVTPSASNEDPPLDREVYWKLLKLKRVTFNRYGAFLSGSKSADILAEYGAEKEKRDELEKEKASKLKEKRKERAKEKEKKALERQRKAAKKLEEKEARKTNLLKRKLSIQKQVDRSKKRRLRKTANSLYCYCNGPFKEDMIGCDACKDWFHFSCVAKRQGTKNKLTAYRAKKRKRFLCQNCSELQSIQTQLNRIG